MGEDEQFNQAEWHYSIVLVEQKNGELALSKARNVSSRKGFSQDNVKALPSATENEGGSE